MAEQKTSISELSAAVSVNSSDLLFISQQSGSSWLSKKATVNQLPFGQGTITGVTMNGASKGTTGVVNLGTVLTAHQSLTGYVPTSRTVAGKALTANITAAELSSAIGLGNYSLTSHNHSGVYAPATHAHGNIQSGGTLQTTDVTIASGDKLVVTDSSDSSKVARTSIAFDGSTTTKFLSQKGTWESASVTGYVSKAELTAAVAGVGAVPSGDGATLSAVIDKYNALVAALTALAT